MNINKPSNRGLYWVKLFFRDLTALTYDLSPDEFGAYMRLFCRICDQQGEPLPNNDAKLARIVSCSAKDWKAIKTGIEPLFEVTDKHWQILSLEDAIKAQLRRNQQNSSSGKKGADARWHPEVVK